MSEHSSPGSPSLSGMRRVGEICVRFEAAWKAGQRPRIEDYVGDVPEPERCHVVWELLCLELAHRRQKRETLTPEEYRQRFPEHVELVQAVFREKDAEHIGEAD